MPSKIRKPSAVLRPGEMDFALRYAQSLAAKGVPGFAGNVYSYPSSALSAIVSAAQAGHLAPVANQEFASIRGKDHKLVAVIFGRDADWVVEVSDRRRHFFALLAAGWSASQTDRLLHHERHPETTLEEMREQIAHVLLAPTSAPVALEPEPEEIADQFI